MDTLLNAVGYCRVSTQRQFTEGHGLERYIDALKRRGLRDDQIYWDIESGASDKRKGYNIVLQLIKEGKVKRLIVPCFDRFTRSPLQWEEAREQLDINGVTLELLDGGEMDINSPDNLLTTRFLAIMAAHTRDKNKYASIQGHKFLRFKEKVLVASFGYKKVDDDLIINKDIYCEDKTYYDIARELVELFLVNRTLSGTVKIMCNRYGFTRKNKSRNGDFPRTVPSLKYWLKNAQLRGYLVYFNHDDKKRIIKQKYESILLDNEWYEINKILSQNKSTKYKKASLVNPLLGLCFCQVCGNRMKNKHSNSRDKFGKQKITYNYLVCQGAYPKAGTSRICDCRSTYKLTIQKAVDAVILALCEKAEVLANQVVTLEVPNIIESEEIKELRNQISKLELFNDPELTDIIATKKTKLTTLLDTNQLVNLDQSEKIDKLKTITANPEFWKFSSIEEQYIIFQDLVQKVECHFGELTVILNI